MVSGILRPPQFFSDFFASKVPDTFFNGLMRFRLAIVVSKSMARRMLSRLNNSMSRIDNMWQGHRFGRLFYSAWKRTNRCNRYDRPFVIVLTRGAKEASRVSARHLSHPEASVQADAGQRLAGVTNPGAGSDHRAPCGQKSACCKNVVRANSFLQLSRGISGLLVKVCDLSHRVPVEHFINVQVLLFRS